MKYPIRLFHTCTICKWVLQVWRSAQQWTKAYRGTGRHIYASGAVDRKRCSYDLTCTDTRRQDNCLHGIVVTVPGICIIPQSALPSKIRSLSAWVWIHCKPQFSPCLIAKYLERRGEWHVYMYMPPSSGFKTRHGFYADVGKWVYGLRRQMRHVNCHTC